jgi:hypothetical protein
VLATGAFLGCGDSGSSSSGGGVACEGATEPATGTLCRQTADCTGAQMCVLQQPTGGCGNPTFLPQLCQVDADCPNSGACLTDMCGGHTCAPACDSSVCTGTDECIDNRCTPKVCDQPGAATCPAGTECAPTSPTASPMGCAAVHCSSGAACPANFDCVATAPGNGCVPRTCSADLECDCGYCVNTRCAATRGFCYEIVAMPYGCVWPYEEVV